MDNQTSRKIVLDTFQDSFDKNRFVFFIKNLLNEIEESGFVYRGNFIPNTYRDSIKSFERIGKYTDGDSKIDILVVNLKKETSVEHARTMQRNFIAWYLNGSRGREMKDAALVAFVSPSQDDWRFSLVKMDYKLGENKNGKVKIKEELTPARRWSFLVGKHEKSHTAQSRLVPIMENDKDNPTLKQLEDAFNIEKVTKEFFEKYRSLYIRMTESLTAIVNEDSKIKKDFDEKSVEIPNFTKKLLGQIVFLYFLQKKGWFGVEKNSGWGTGPKDFLRLLFEKKITKYKNFFNDMLEPLFYEALAKERDKDFYSRFNCKIPFLNGGLFDPINDYDWVHTDINLPNELFSNDNKTKEGDIGDGILDIFDRYNFTVKEDEPLEKEVAVDPEMLGKVFENLLEVKDRKSKGTYYTPREIVHYMCRESLINYLATEHSNLSLENIRNYVNYSDALSVDIKKLNKVWKGESFTQGQFRELDDLLKNIKIVDPACGSGAFLVGMLHEIVKLRLFLQLTPDSELFSKSPDSIKELSVYKLKEEIIQRCIYGVDIDPGAVEIAKLRLWLSLIVEEEDIRQIRPLPNLDYKIMQGNSLLEEFEGVKLFDEKLLKEQVRNSDDVERLKKMFEKQSEMERKLLPFYKQNPKWLTNKKIERPIELFKLEEEMKKIQYQIKHETEMMRIDTSSEMNGRLKFDDYSGRSEVIGGELKKLHDKFFKSSSGQEKNELKKEIEQLEWLLIEETLKEQNKKSALRKLEKYKKDKIKPFFLWKLNFGEVFQEKGGFDVVIANPPYVRADSPKFKKEREAIMKSKQYQTLYEKWDLFVPFIEKGLKLLNDSGSLVYITSNSLCTSKFAFRILDYIQENYFTLFVDYFEKVKVFDAGVVPVVFGVSKQNTSKMVIKTVHNEKFDIIHKKDEIPIDEFRKLGKNGFKASNSIFRLNADAIKLGDICYLSKGMVINADEKSAQGEFTKDDLLSGVKTAIHSRKYIEGKDIGCYFVKRFKYLEWGTERVPSKLSRQTFPELYNRLKIMRGRVTGGILDDTSLICNDSIVVFVRFSDLKNVDNKSISSSIKKYNSLPRAKLNDVSEKFDLKYLLAIINSKFAYNFLNGIRRHRLKNYFYPDDFRNLPIADSSSSTQKPFIEIVDKILAITKSGDYLENPEKQVKVKEYEKQIDQMVYKLYGLTEDEIKIVENG